MGWQGGSKRQRFLHNSFAVRALSDRKSTRLNSSHTVISYAVFCLKKKNNVNRAPAMPRSAALVTALREAGLLAVISGAGPTVHVPASREMVPGVLCPAPRRWQATV